MNGHEFLQALPLQKRLQAKENTRKLSYKGLRLLNKDKTELNNMFKWADSRQGGTYWVYIHWKYGIKIFNVRVSFRYGKGGDEKDSEVYEIKAQTTEKALEIGRSKHKNSKAEII